MTFEFVKRRSPNVVSVGDVAYLTPSTRWAAMGHDGLWRVQQVHPFVRWVMA